MGSRSSIKGLNKGPEEQQVDSARPSDGDDTTFSCRLARLDISLQPGPTGNGLGLTQVRGQGAQLPE